MKLCPVREKVISVARLWIALGVLAATTPLLVVQLAAAAVPTAEQLAARPSTPPAPVAAGAEKLGLHPAAPTAPAAAAPSVAPPEAPSPVAKAFTDDDIATAEKPAGFSYSLVREAWIDDVRETYLYVKSSPTMASSIAVPIPKNRDLLAKCIHGGTIDDLVRSATAMVKFDPAGVVRPDITILKKAEVEIYDDAKVLDRGGTRLYITTKDGRSRGFELAGGAAAWDEVIEGAKFADLSVGTIVRVENDPGGRKPIRVIFKRKAEAVGAAGPKGADKGCGCDMAGAPTPSWGALLLGLALLGGLWSRRRGHAPRR